MQPDRERLVRSDMLIRAALGGLLGLVVAVGAHRTKALTVDGGVAAVVIASVIVAAGGFSWGALLVLFFISSSLLSRLLKADGRDQIAAKGDRRDAFQVLANGGIPAVYAVLQLIHPTGLWTAGYGTAVAAATADTWATEIGKHSATPPRLVITGERVPVGTSGGVTPMGLGGMIAGAALIGLTSAALRTLDPATALFVAAGGAAGGLIDSYLGAALQEVRFCPACSLRTEQNPHLVCGTPTYRVKGLGFITNDTVNAASPALGSLIIVALAAVLGGRL